MTTVRFQFFDQALDGLLRTEIQRPCVPGERFRVNIDLGPYNIRTQGLNGQAVICYESNEFYTVSRAGTMQLNVSVEAHPSGAQGGCQYPTIM